MPTKVIFKPNKKGVAAIAVSGPVYRAVHKVAEKGERYAVSISPVDTGEYSQSFHILPTSTRIAGMWRAAATLINTAPHAAAVEWGNAATRGKGHHVLRKTLTHLNRGGRVRL